MQYKVVPHYLFTELCTAKSLTSVKSRKLLQVWRKELYLSFKLPNWKETRIRKCQITRWISHHYKLEKIQGHIRFLTKERILYTFYCTTMPNPCWHSNIIQVQFVCQFFRKMSSIVEKTISSQFQFRYLQSLLFLQECLKNIGIRDAIFKFFHINMENIGERGTPVADSMG